jgi:hypothetical protein
MSTPAAIGITTAATIGAAFTLVAVDNEDRPMRPF